MAVFLDVELGANFTPPSCPNGSFGSARGNPFAEPPKAPPAATHEGLVEAILAWWEEHECDTVPFYCSDEYAEERNLYDEPPEFVPIAKALAEAPAAPAIPDGYQVLPIRPTPEMLRRARNAPMPAVLVDSISAREDLRNTAIWDAMRSGVPEVTR